jgi:uncharacterized repeat protein (TIGR03943 family)
MNRYKTYFTTTVLSGYFIFLFFLLRTGTIRKFINPRLSFLTVITLVILGAMILYNLARIAAERNSRHPAGGSGHEAHCGHHHREGVAPGSYLLFVPVLMSLLIAPQSLSYSGNSAPPLPASQPPAGDSGWKLSSSGTAQLSNGAASYSLSDQPAAGAAAAPAVAAGAATEYTQLEIGDIIFDTLKAPRQKLLRSRIRLIGKVLRSPLLKPDEIVLYRMIITCCAADGLAAGVRVKLPGPASFQAEEWVGVEGTLQLLPFDPKLQSIDPIISMVTPEKIYPYFTATTVYKVDPPRDEYLYP